MTRNKRGWVDPESQKTFRTKLQPVPYADTEKNYRLPNHFNNQEQLQPVHQYQHQLQQQVACDGCTAVRLLPRNCSYPLGDFVLTSDASQPPSLLRRYMEREMEVGGTMNTLYSIDFYGTTRRDSLGSTIDIDSEFIMLRVLLQINRPLNALQQQQLNAHMDNLLELTIEELIEKLEESFLSGLLDAAQLHRLHNLLPVANMPKSIRELLQNFYRRLIAELPNTRYDLTTPKHIGFLAKQLDLRDETPKPQAKRLLAAVMEHMNQLPDMQLVQFWEQFNPAQLQQMLHQLCNMRCNRIYLPSQQLQRLLHVLKRVIKGMRKLKLHSYEEETLIELLSTPLDVPINKFQRQFLQLLLDHLLPMPKIQQFNSLRRLPLNAERVHRLRLMLHNPALLYDLPQLRQLNTNLVELIQWYNRPQ